MTQVSGLITAAFAQASNKYPDLHKRWIQTSVRVGGLIPASLLMASVQHDGNLDLVLRAMEDENTPPEQAADRLPMFASHYQKMLSELWVGSLYETTRLLIERKLNPDTDEFKLLAHDLRLLRIPLEKHEITSQGQLSQPLQMRRYPLNNDATDVYVYNKTDPKRAHIMPAGVSPRGSVVWQVLDVKANEERWVERRALSDRFLSLWVADQPAALA
jgi:hypothetical protein